MFKSLESADIENQASNDTANVRTEDLKERELIIDDVFLDTCNVQPNDPRLDCLQSVKETIEHNTRRMHANDPQPDYHTITANVENPINEFVENDQLYTLAFPTLFLLGNPFKNTGSMSESLSIFFPKFS